MDSTATQATEQRVDYPVPGTDGAVIVRRLPNAWALFRGEPKYVWLIVHRLTDAAFCNVGTKGAGMTLAKAMYQRLPPHVWAESDMARVGAAFTPEFMAWVKAEAKATRKTRFA